MVSVALNVGGFSAIWCYGLTQDQHSASLFHIGLDLLHQGIHIAEFQFVSQSVAKIKLEPLTINVAVKIQKIRFNPQVFTFKGGAIAQTAHRHEPFIAQCCPACVNAISRQDLFRPRFEVCGGEANCATAMITVYDDALDNVGTAQPLGSLLDSPCLQFSTDCAAADSNPIFVSAAAKQIDLANFKALCLALRGEVLEIALALIAHCKISGDPQAVHFQMFK